MPARRGRSHAPGNRARARRRSARAERATRGSPGRAAIGPEIACLQEIKTDDTKFPAGALEAAGYGAVWHGQRAHHGVAILAKGEAPREIRRGLPGDASDMRALLSPSLVPRLQAAGVDRGHRGREKPSDHALAWISLAPPGAEPT